MPLAPWTTLVLFGAWLPQELELGRRGLSDADGCAAGQARDTSCSASDDEVTCVPCPAGSYQDGSECVEADWLYYVPHSGSVAADRLRCPNNTAYVEVVPAEILPFDLGNAHTWPTLRPLSGATSADDCTCRAGYYWGDWEQADGCRPCEDGAICFGDTFPPIAQRGYGALENNYTGRYTPFHKCANYLQCLETGTDGDKCDCLGGNFTAGDGAPSEQITVSMCGHGYVSDSPLCSTCNAGFAKLQGQCTECQLTPGWYFLALTVYIVSWFTILRHLLTKRIKSLYTSIAFLQFLGVYSKFEIEWRSELRPLFKTMTLVSLNVENIHFPCAWDARGGLPYTAQWLFQLLLPMLYPLVVVCHNLTMRCVAWLARHRRLPTQLMMKLGWRPRGHVNRNTYLAPAIFYLNMYYSKGVSLSFEMLACNTKDDRPHGDGASCYEGGCYLIAQPGLTCWEGEHRRLATLAVIMLLVYLVGLPCLYIYVLFRLVPRVGLNDIRAISLFGFLYTRFRPELWAWEIVEMVRKLPMAFLAYFGKSFSPVYQSSLAIGVVFLVMLADMMKQPFATPLGNWLENTTALTEFVILLLGVMTLYRSSACEELAQYAASPRSFAAQCPSNFSWIEAVAWTFLIVSFVMIGLTVLVDLDLQWQLRRAHRLRRATGCSISADLFDLRFHSNLILDWLEQASNASITRFRKVDKMLLKHVIRGDLKVSTITKRYARQAKVEPFLLDRIVEINRKQRQEAKASGGRGNPGPRGKLGSPNANASAPRKQNQPQQKEGGRSGVGSAGGGGGGAGEQKPYVDGASDGTSALRAYLGTLAKGDDERDIQVPSMGIFNAQLSGSLLRWMCEAAHDHELERLRGFLSDVQAYERRRYESFSFSQRLWKRLVGIERRKEHRQNDKVVETVIQKRRTTETFEAAQLQRGLPQGLLRRASSAVGLGGAGGNAAGAPLLPGLASGAPGARAPPPAKGMAERHCSVGLCSVGGPANPHRRRCSIALAAAEEAQAAQAAAEAVAAAGGGGGSSRWSAVRDMRKSGRFSADNTQRLRVSIELEDLLQHLATQLPCEAVLLLPVPGASIEAPEISAANQLEDLLDDSMADAGSSRAATLALGTYRKLRGWQESSRTPAGLCVQSRMPVLVENVFLDRRFDTKAFSLEGGISQLCFPVPRARASSADGGGGGGGGSGGSGGGGGGNARSGSSIAAGADAVSMGRALPDSRGTSICSENCSESWSRAGSLHADRPPSDAPAGSCGGSGGGSLDHRIAALTAAGGLGPPVRSCPSWLPTVVSGRETTTSRASHSCGDDDAEEREHGHGHGHERATTTTTVVAAPLTPSEKRGSCALLAQDVTVLLDSLEDSPGHSPANSRPASPSGADGAPPEPAPAPRPSASVAEPSASVAEPSTSVATPSPSRRSAPRTSAASRRTGGSVDSSTRGSRSTRVSTLVAHVPSAKQLTDGLHRAAGTAAAVAASALHEAKGVLEHAEQKAQCGLLGPAEVLESQISERSLPRESHRHASTTSTHTTSGDDALANEPSPSSTATGGSVAPSAPCSAAAAAAAATTTTTTTTSNASAEAVGEPSLPRLLLETVEEPFSEEERRLEEDDPSEESDGGGGGGGGVAGAAGGGHASSASASRKPSAPSEAGTADESRKHSALSHSEVGSVTSPQRRKPDLRRKSTWASESDLTVSTVAYRSRLDVKRRVSGLASFSFGPMARPSNASLHSSLLSKLSLRSTGMHDPSLECVAVLVLINRRAHGTTRVGLPFEPDDEEFASIVAGMVAEKLATLAGHRTSEAGSPGNRTSSFEPGATFLGHHVSSEGTITESSEETSTSLPPLPPLARARLQGRRSLLMAPSRLAVRSSPAARKSGTAEAPQWSAALALDGRISPSSQRRGASGPQDRSATDAADGCSPPKARRGTVATPPSVAQSALQRCKSGFGFGRPRSCDLPPSFARQLSRRAPSPQPSATSASAREGDPPLRPSLRKAASASEAEEAPVRSSLRKAASAVECSQRVSFAADVAADNDWEHQDDEDEDEENEAAENEAAAEDVAAEAEVFSRGGPTAAGTARANPPIDEDMRRTSLKIDEML